MKVVLTLLINLTCATIAVAQHGIDVEQKAANGDYMAALVTYDKMPKRIVTTKAQIAAARSAWALGLADRAMTEFDKALQQGGLTPTEMAKIYLSKGIIDFQEGRPQVALVNVDRAMAQLPAPSPLRGQVFALWGESLQALNQIAPAEEKLRIALNEVDADLTIEIHFHLGEVLKTLGKYDEARVSFEKVPLRHERAPEAMRQLAEIALDTKDYAGAGFWIEHGRTEFPDRFLDSWCDYVLMKSATSTKNQHNVRTVLDAAQKRYAPSDPWLALLSAEAEQYEWTQRQKVAGEP